MRGEREGDVASPVLINSLSAWSAVPYNSAVDYDCYYCYDYY